MVQPTRVAYRDIYVHNDYIYPQSKLIYAFWFLVVIHIFVVTRNLKLQKMLQSSATSPPPPKKKKNQQKSVSS